MIFKLKSLGRIENYERVPDREFGLDEAVFDPYGGILKIKESVFIAANSGAPRARFTIAHEIGHIMLGHNRIRHRRLDYDAKSATSPVLADEMQANMFAGAFLAPYHLSGITLSSSIDELSERFQISSKAAEIRLPELQRLYRIENKIPRPLPASVTKFLEENRNAGRKPG
ncbi:ImmA/IrrE family metallo-endopeptidase [Ancylobacter polymorphus]|uniref:Zn-dependent peptidase ImmA (M78 family) n=1 Tax=Ancylobacter polymorphus TaxID=223390 RepID=A0ABU0BJ24_9HYPH|nr:ImmA/IrrE family metallo-endopeptidase [Ancylobacter polymorphus]MDQ0305258.1 Zn-dependent peptidase ImmA (M78 family) [Ancylobacter polymorphus]